MAQSHRVARRQLDRARHRAGIERALRIGATVLGVIALWKLARLTR